jgi:hypothetical protein
VHASLATVEDDSWLLQGWARNTAVTGLEKGCFLVHRSSDLLYSCFEIISSELRVV